jgi:hypothetical protein
MTLREDFLAEKTRIEKNIVIPIAEVLNLDLGKRQAQSIIDACLADHQANSDLSSLKEDIPITILTQRRIELELIRFFYQDLLNRFGLDTAKRLIGQAIINDAREAGRKKGALVVGPTDLLTFAEILPQRSAGGALEMNVLKSTVNELRYVVTRCRYAEMYRKMGLGDLGFLVSCGRDGAFMEGYAPKVTLTRAKTIMTGDPTCEFYYHTVAE